MAKIKTDASVDPTVDSIGDEYDASMDLAPKPIAPWKRNMFDCCFAPEDEPEPQLVDEVDNNQVGAYQEEDNLSVGSQTRECAELRDDQPEDDLSMEDVSEVQAKEEHTTSPQDSNPYCDTAEERTDTAEEHMDTVETFSRGIDISFDTEDAICEVEKSGKTENFVPAILCVISMLIFFMFKGANVLSLVPKTAIKNDL
mmetsp:Transcript_7973/g.16895  ORF Transcript_7973/g.16895 Transcript_7973/m.16895 type:complete len:199 (-) Transcript_7973:363-959(-)|eukprot:CAMPEP_0183313566 /NCGR_PEP_ID=MMETSP0160_2-20130417/45721_1 /TAXON_ID=2839 ORGANISM="Odontella Sinensis, Strain Grunow 1884" /NCGR_SAMPLE_ID=MMETSP0160_2 /ASSEMBLY_ACC=CAM_ASM_000250 /LENGTH=198 /DNA_ID=CAMNT_0025478679 /DNA_START=62 /DNA_END=658 /DNA_ORIENTATION=-